MQLDKINACHVIDSNVINDSFINKYYYAYIIFMSSLGENLITNNISGHGNISKSHIL